MHRSFFFLARTGYEIGHLFSGYSLEEAFSQEADKLLLSCRNNQNSLTIGLEISCDSAMPYLLPRKNFSRANKNVAGIFQSSLRSDFLDVSIAQFDRVLKIAFSDVDIFYFIRGAATNVVFFPRDAEPVFFKSVNRAQRNGIIAELNAFRFVAPDGLPDCIRKLSGGSISAVPAVSLPFISKDILTRLTIESDLKSRRFYPELSKWTSSVLQDNISLAESAEGEHYLLLPNLRINDDTLLESHPSVFEAFRAFIRLKMIAGSFRQLKTIAEKKLLNEQKYLRGKLVQFTTILEKLESPEELTEKANLLLANARQISRGAAEIILPSFEDESILVKIPLDVKLSPYQNADKYFEKSYGRKMERENAAAQMPGIEKKLRAIGDALRELASITTNETMEKFMQDNQIAIRDNEARNPDKSGKFRRYLVFQKYEIFVGKDSANNDELTMRFAKQNDYWFHARGCSGSHVVLRFAGKEEKPVKEVLEIAASIAAFYSKAKHAKLVQVAYTQKKFVTKRKGMPAGQVIMLKESILHVKPEISPKAEPVT